MQQYVGEGGLQWLMKKHNFPEHPVGQEIPCQGNDAEACIIRDESIARPSKDFSQFSKRFNEILFMDFITLIPYFGQVWRNDFSKDFIALEVRKIVFKIV